MSNKIKRGRDLHGLVVLDKPLNISSNHALQRVKRLLNAKKAGHTGTLDPLATGVLVLCLGRATKIADHVANADKRYFVVAKLGQQTQTGDLEGEVIKQTQVSEQHLAQVPAVIAQFIGSIEQIPPMYSALKKDGVALYKLARQGTEVERSARTVSIAHIGINDISHDTVSMTVACSKGTYIRTLVEDIGKTLGCYAHVHTLRRLSVGQFGDNYPMVTLEEIEQRAHQRQNLEHFILPARAAFSQYPAITLNDGLILMLEKGRKFKLSAENTSGFIRIIDTHEIFRGLADVEQGQIVKFRQF